MGATRKKTGLHHPVAVYAKQTVSGRLKKYCAPLEIYASQRHLNDLKRQGTKDFPYVFDETRADRIIEFYKHLNQSRGVYAGTPIVLQPWQMFDLGCVYGWVHKDTGARRFKRTYNLRARGNFKSTEKSGQCLYHMCADAMYPPYKPELAKFEAWPEVECAAVDGKQAKRVYGDACEIARRSPAISKRLKIPVSLPVSHKTRGGAMSIVSKNADNLDSGAPIYVVIDEYHAHPNSKIFNVKASSLGKHPQCLLDVITTAGDHSQTKPCYREQLYAESVLKGDITDENYFAQIRAVPQGSDIHDKNTWYFSNPCFRYPDDYSSELLTQTEIEHTAAYSSLDPDKIREFLIKRLCMWQVGSVNHYLNEYCEKKLRESFVSSSEFSKICSGSITYFGFDLGKRIDLTGVGSVHILSDGRIGISAIGLMPENSAERHERGDRVPYIHWAKDGFCILTSGDVTDNSYVKNWICNQEKRLNVKAEEICYDGHNAVELANEFCSERNNEDICVEIAQSCAGQNLAVKGFRELLLKGKLVIEYNPLFLWCCLNACEIINNYGDIKLSKRHKDDTERIDPLAAVINALARALIRYEQPTIKDKISRGEWTL